MRLPNDKSKYTSQFKYVEVMAYMPNLERVVRIQEGPKNDKAPVFWDIGDISRFSEQYNHTGVYTSVWQYNRPSVDNSIPLGPLYFDLDSPDLGASLGDAIRLYERLRESIPSSAIRVYFTGYKGFHIECEPIALGITPGPNLASVFRFIAGRVRDEIRLETLDFQVYDSRRMWRIPYTRHQVTGLYKFELSEDLLLSGSVDAIKEGARLPDPIPVPEQSFDYKSNEWYREFTYRLEEEKQGKSYTTQDLLERFAKHGTKMLKKVDKDRDFDPKSLFDGCHAILDWWKYAEENKDLPHEARLFLLSILSYNEEALFYLHEILKNCSDYSWERSNAHIQDWIRRRELGIGGRPYSCERANGAGVGCGDCSLEAKRKWVEINGKLLETDETASPSPIRFGYKRKD